MKLRNDIEQLRIEGERGRRCFYPNNHLQQQALAARLHGGQFIRPYRNMYARSEYWHALPPPEQARHIIRAMSHQYPNRVFAGLSAAAMLHLEYPWKLHHDESVFIASPRGRSTGTYSRLHHIVMRTAPTCTLVDHFGNGQFATSVIPETLASAAASGSNVADTVNIVRITTPARTLIDCGLRYPFVQALPMFDSALRNNLVTRGQVLDLCNEVHIDCSCVLRLLHYANPLNENGGESLCYGTIIDEGFAVPQLQHVFIDPDNPWVRHRADFVWHTHDGRVIVLEYDGTRKYVDPKMTHRRGIQDVIRDERDREDALRRAKVTDIIRTTYDEVVQRTPLKRKLLDADVPMTVANPQYERCLDIRGRER